MEGRKERKKDTRRVELRFLLRNEIPSEGEFISEGEFTSEGKFVSEGQSASEVMVLRKEHLYAKGLWKGCF